MKSRLPVIIILVVLVVAAGGGYWLYQNSGSEPVVTPSGASLPASTPDAAPTPTPARSFVTIEEFGDYQCPPCGAVHPSLKKIKAEYGEKIRFTFRHFPLTKIHANAQPAALAAVAAGFQGKFWEMHDELYSSQETWSEAPNVTPYLAGLAQRLNLNIDRFLADMASPRALGIVIADQQEGLSRGVNSTPTVIINGSQLASESLAYEKLREEVDREVRKLVKK